MIPWRDVRGADPICLLTFLSTVTDELRTLQASEAASFRLLIYLLEGDAQYLYTSVVTPGVRTSGPRKACGWPQLIHTLLRLYPKGRCVVGFVWTRHSRHPNRR